MVNITQRRKKLLSFDSASKISQSCEMPAKDFQQHEIWSLSSGKFRRCHIKFCDVMVYRSDRHNILRSRISFDLSTLRWELWAWILCPLVWAAGWSSAYPSFQRILSTILLAKKFAKTFQSHRHVSCFFRKSERAIFIEGDRHRYWFTRSSY